MGITIGKPDRNNRDDRTTRHSSDGLRNGDLSLATNVFPCTFEELLIATENFEKDNFLGGGSFGRVYRGYLERLERDVAVKQLNSQASLHEFDTEIRTLSSVDHDNLLKLYGYYAQGCEKVLIFEYMPLKSLDLHLHDVGYGRKALDWTTRMNIAAGIAQGLVYIQTRMIPPIIHGDLKSSNILLGKTYHPKLSGFGLSTVAPTGNYKHVSVKDIGTMGYLAPEYIMTGRLSNKSDIYSFGVVLLEILTGRKAYDWSKPYDEQSLVKWVQPLIPNRKNFTIMADPLLKGQFPEKDFERAMCIAAICVYGDPDKRKGITWIEPRLSKLASQPDSLNPLNTSIIEIGEHSGIASTAQVDQPSSTSNISQLDQPSGTPNTIQVFQSSSTPNTICVDGPDINVVTSDVVNDSGLKQIVPPSSENGDFMCLDGSRNGDLSLARNAREAHRFPFPCTFDELLIATENFEKDNFLGGGSFGSVYKGYLARLEGDVAIKQLSTQASLHEFDNEIRTLSSVDHDNLLKLYGYCAQGCEKVLIFEYMPLKSLDLHLHDVGCDRKALDWTTRMTIAAGIAQGLVYIHTRMIPPIIHCDLKSSNILLGKTYHPKLSGFGLSTVGPTEIDKHVSVNGIGTMGYLAPEYIMTSHISNKSDIYSFGVVLLEILTGRKAYDPSKPYDEQSLVKWVQPLISNRKNFAIMADPLLKGQFPEKSFERAMCIAAICIYGDPYKRKEMTWIEPRLSDLASQPYSPKPLNTSIMEIGEHSGNCSNKQHRGQTSSNPIPIQEDQPSCIPNTRQVDQRSSTSNTSQLDQPSSTPNTTHVDQSSSTTNTICVDGPDINVVSSEEVNDSDLKKIVPPSSEKKVDQSSSSPNRICVDGPDINAVSSESVQRKNVPPSSKPYLKILIYGNTGWLGGLLGKFCEKQGIPYECGKGRLEERSQILADILTVKPTHVFNAASVSGRLNVDWYETHKPKTIHTNVVGTLNLADICREHELPMMNYATGCIFEYDDAHPEGSGIGFEEEDIPNFFGSFYSKTKAMVEDLLTNYENVCTLRVRMPISSDLSNPFNFITKISRYNKMVNIPNSMTVLDELLPISVEMAKRNCTGIWNFTNPGAISLNEILELYIKYIDPTFESPNFTLEEQAKVIVAAQSNNEMDGSKLKNEFPELLSIKDSLIKYVFEPNKKA